MLFFGKSVGVTADELGRADKKMRLMTDALVADVYIYIGTARLCEGNKGTEGGTVPYKGHQTKEIGYL